MFEFDPDAVRAIVEAHLRESGSLRGLDIQRNRPSVDIRFAIVGYPPKARSRSNWHRCSYCETDRKFAAGFIILGEDGLLRLIGIDCWRHHLDEEAFEVERGNYRQYRVRQSFLTIYPELSREVESYFPALRQAAEKLNHPVRALENLSGQIANRARPLWSFLNRARKTGAILDIARPPTQAERRAAELSGRPVPPSVGETIAVVRGINILEPKYASHKLDRISEMLGEFRELMENQDWQQVPTHVLWSRIRRLKTIGQAIEEVVGTANATISEGLLFLDEQNIQDIVRWANHPYSDFRDQGQLALQDRNIVYDSSDGRLSIVPLPDPSLLQTLLPPTGVARLLSRIS